MLLVDQQTKRVVTPSIRTSYDFLHRLKGLMFTRDLPEDQTMHIKPCRSIHTCFMRFPIDVVFVNEDLEIVATEEQMKPFRFGKPVSNAHSVFEFKAGTIQSKELYLGQSLQILKEREMYGNVKEVSR